VERLSARALAPEDRAIRDALGAVYRDMRAAAELDAGGATSDRRADELSASVASTARALLAAKGGYQPALVGVAARLSAASAEARRLSDALAAGDEPRARSARTAIGDGLVWSAGQLAALLDAGAATRGSEGAPTSPADRRAASYFRRLAGER
jgi:hypothetical protein